MHRRPGSTAAFAAARALAIAALVVTGALGAAAVAVYKLTGPGATPAAAWKSALLEGLVWRALSAAPGIVASVDVLPPPDAGGGDDATSTLASVRVRGVGGAGDLTALWSFLGTNATAALNDGVAALGLPGWDVRATLVSVSAEEVGTVGGGKGKKNGGPAPLAVPAEARVKPGAAAPGPAPAGAPTATAVVSTTPAAFAAPPATPAATTAPPATPAATASPPPAPAATASPPPPPSSPTPTPEPKQKRDAAVAAISPAPSPLLPAAQPPATTSARQPSTAPPAQPPAPATPHPPAPAPSPRPAIFAPSGAAATAGAAVPVALTLRLAGAEGAPLDAPAARAALSAAVSQAATEVGLAVEDAQVLDVQRSTAPFPNPRRALRQTPPSPSTPHPQVVDARVAVVGAPRASRRGGGGASRDTAESLLSSPAFAAAVKRGMAAAGFPVDVAVVGVSATGAVAAAPAVSAGPTVAPARRDPPAVAVASAAPTSKAGVIGGALAGLLAVGGVLAAAALFAARQGRGLRLRLPSSADGGACALDKDAAAAAGTVDDNDTFHDATADGAASECGTDAGVAALAATPGVSRVMAALRAAAAARAAAVATAAPPPAGDVLGGRYVVGERLGRRVCAARDMQAVAADSASTDAADPASVVLKLYDAADAAAADALVSLTRHGGPGGCPLVGVLPVTADVTIQPALRILISPRGQFSLADWLAGTRGRRPERGTAAARYTAAAVAARVAALHSARVAHRVLDPRRFVWRGGDWWLTVTAAAAVVGGKSKAAPAVVVGALRYAAPETLAAVAAGHRTLAPSLASDAWSLGVILYEVFAGKPLFPAAARDAAVAGALLGLAPLPTEASSSAWRAVRDPAARVLLQGLLVREPGARLTVEDALKSPALGGV